VSELQHTYADQGVVVIGVNVWERDLALPEPFVQKQGDRMGYRVAMEITEKGQAKGKMATEWLAAAGRNGIPCSFIVDKQGKIAWIGHPVAMDGPLAKVVAGTFDIAQQAKDDEAVAQLQKEFSEAARAKDYEKAIGLIDQILTYQPGMALYMQGTKINFLYQKGDYIAANTQVAQLAATDVAKDPMRATSLAYTMLAAPDVQKVDLDLMMKLAEAGAAKLKEDPSGVLAANTLLAKAYAAKKDFAKAIEHQQKVVEALTESAKAAPENQAAFALSRRDAAQKELEKYKEQATK
jgi:tetratricopeptide (TPR) repeat protein